MNPILKDAKIFSEWLNAAPQKELAALIQYFCDRAKSEERLRLSQFANELKEVHYGKKVYFRGLIEFTSFCRNNCYYCGLQKNNRAVTRYRLTEKEILACCQSGYALGFRTFVLQGGEDAYFNDSRLCQIISQIKQSWPDCAVTLSIGERSYDSYQKLFDAGADRYLLRHETADQEHYGKLHPPELSFENRQRCLYDLKKIGYQVGAGFMVDSPFQTVATLADDFIFLRQLDPQMIGIGPFIPHCQTPFADYYQPSPERTLVILSLIRIMLPKAMLPATTALGTVNEAGREKGLLAGANVVMPNLSPLENRDNYNLYDHKLCTGKEAAEHLPELVRQIESLGLTPDFSRGDYVDFDQGDAVY